MSTVSSEHYNVDLLVNICVRIITGIFYCSGQELLLSLLLLQTRRIIVLPCVCFFSHIFPSFLAMLGSVFILSIFSASFMFETFFESVSPFVLKPCMSVPSDSVIY